MSDSPPPEDQPPNPLKDVISDALHDVLTVEKWKRFIMQVVTGAEPDGILHDDLEKARAAFEDLHIAAVLAAMWEDGLVEVAYADGELIWRRVVVPG
jgi:hypothetical protein